MAFQGMDPEAHEPRADLARLIEAPPELQSLGEQVVEQLKTVYDPEIPVDIYELGLIYTVKIEEGGSTSIRMTLTSPMCPAAPELMAMVKAAAESIESVSEANVQMVWEPPWDPKTMASDDAKDLLGIW